MAVVIRGRGACSNPDNRFDAFRREEFDDGWSEREDACHPRRELIADSSRSVICHNDSPDVPFGRSINPYRGCEHGCIYCFARPSHAYLGHSPGLDFETRIHFKPDAVRLLREELSRPGYRCEPIALGVNTDAYQPAERELGITRGLLEVLRDSGHPVSLITKSALVERDLDLLVELAGRQLVQVMVSLTTLDRDLARRMEPRAATPGVRVRLIQRLRAAGIPVGVLIAPLIPFLNDAELEDLLETAHAAGALQVEYVLLRLPREVGPLFGEWLRLHYPDRARRVLARMRDCHEGRLNDPRFGHRMRGRGVFAQMLQKRFERAAGALGFSGLPDMRCDHFRSPGPEGQLSLFD